MDISSECSLGTCSIKCKWQKIGISHYIHWLTTNLNPLFLIWLAKLSNLKHKALILFSHQTNEYMCWKHHWPMLNVKQNENTVLFSIGSKGCTLCGFVNQCIKCEVPKVSWIKHWHFQKYLYNICTCIFKTFEKVFSCLLSVSLMWFYEWFLIIHIYFNINNLLYINPIRWWSTLHFIH